MHAMNVAENGAENIGRKNMGGRGHTTAPAEITDAAQSTDAAEITDAVEITDAAKTTDPADITGLILAGGRGSRMGDVDKGCILLQGRPMVEYVAARFAPQVGSLLISANRNLQRYAEYGKVVTDDPAHGDWQGPLAGVAAGMAAARSPWVATAPCDSPFLPRDMVARLRQALQMKGDREGKGARLAVASSHGRRHAVCMLLSRELLPDLLRYFAGGGRRVYTWQQQVGCVEVPFDDQPDAFMNVNTADELADARIVCL